MIKIKSISMISACAALIMVSSPAKALITLDPGNIAGTIGIVINGVTGIMQSVEIITNGSLLNSVLGDAAGTLAKFKDKFGGDIQKALKAAEEAKRRIEEGKAAYNKYKNEIENRKARYQALLDQLNLSGNKQEYNDDSSEYDAYDGGDSGGDADNLPSTVDAGSQSDDSNLPSTVDAGNGGNTTVSAGNQNSGGSDVDSGGNTVVSAGNQNSGGGSIFDAGTNSGVTATRQPFSQVEDIVVDSELSGKSETPTKGTVKSAVEQAAEAATDAATSEKTPSIKHITPASESSSGSPLFRVSPTKLKGVLDADKISSNEMSFVSNHLFADLISSEKGVNYDSKGTFITPLAKRCGVSVKDLTDMEGMKSCLTKIVLENNAKDQEDAINSRKDCEAMVYETVVALLAEATNARYEASNYSDTLDKQEGLASDSSTIRDDTGVIAMSNEQVQILLNKMSMQLSGDIMLDATQQLCGTTRNVLVDSQKAEGSAGGD